jgi:phosphate transport system substrate-binding protein
MSEADCFKALLNDSVKVIMSTRMLNDIENKYFKSRNLIPITTKVARDGIALIINKNNTDSLLKISQLRKILSGETTTWQQLNPKSTKGKINVVFDSNGSSTVRLLNDSLMKTKGFPSNCFAVKSNIEVINYVQANENAIGIIGVNWISDKDDPKMLSFNSKIRVMWLAKRDDANYPDDYFGPYQAYMYTNDYPLTREVYLINREGRPGLGTGFASFVAGEQGQRIMRLSGLLPSSPYTRNIKLN